MFSMAWLTNYGRAAIFGRSSIWPLAKNAYTFYVLIWLQNSKEEEYFVIHEDYMHFKCQLPE